MVIKPRGLYQGRATEAKKKKKPQKTGDLFYVQNKKWSAACKLNHQTEKSV